MLSGGGEQSIILRKGGMAEGRGGFSFRHREFFLFPTFFHEQLGKVRNGPVQLGEAAPSMAGHGEPLILTFSRGEKEPRAVNEDEVKPEDGITISLFAVVERAVRVDSLKTAEALAPVHVLKPQIVRERFGYKHQGLNVAFVRVYRLEQPWVVANEKKFGGCR